MTPIQKKVFQLLMNDHYMVVTQNIRGRKCWKVYDPEKRPVMYCHFMKDPLKRVLKHNKKGQITINLSLVRQEHGSSFMKTFYKSWKHKK